MHLSSLQQQVCICVALAQTKHHKHSAKALNLRAKVTWVGKLLIIQNEWVYLAYACIIKAGALYYRASAHCCLAGALINNTSAIT